MKTTILALFLSTAFLVQTVLAKTENHEMVSANLKINKSFFIGKWKHENAILSFKSNGNYSYKTLIDNGQNVSSKWSLKDNIITLAGLYDIEILSIKNKKQFTYRIVGGNTIFVAKKQLIKRKHHKKRLVTKPIK